MHRMLYPGTPCTEDSSSLGARRRLGQNATNTTAGVLVGSQYCSEATMGLIIGNMSSSTKPEVHNASQRPRCHHLATAV